MRRHALGIELIECRARALGDGPGGGVVEIDRIRGPRKFRLPDPLAGVADGFEPRGVRHDVRHAARGVRASRSPSPNRLMPTTVRPMASPGNSDTHGATRSRSRPSATIAPHEGVGGAAPSPTNDKAASAMIAP